MSRMKSMLRLSYPTLTKVLALFVIIPALLFGFIDTSHAQLPGQEPDLQASNQQLAQATGNAPANPGEVPQNDEDNSGCGWTNIWQCLVNMVDQTVATIAYALMWIFSWIPYLGGLTLDFTVRITILEFGKFVSGNESLAKAWTLFRDLGNIIFIFSIVYLGVQLILNKTQEVQKRLGWILLAALLINFSLFFTKAAIDFSNVATAQLYNGMLATVSANSSNNSTSFSSFMMDQFQLGNLWNKSPAEDDFNPNGVAKGAADTLLSSVTIKLWIQAIAACILMSVVGFTFFIMGFLFIQRTLILLYLMVISPLYFMGWASPLVKKQFGHWPKSLLTQTLFPIIFFLLMIVVTLFISSVRNLASTGPSPTNVSAFIGMSFVDLIVYAMLVMAVVGALKYARDAANKLGSEAEKAISGGVNTLRNFTSRRIAGAAGYAYSGARAGVARPAQRLTQLVGDKATNLYNTDTKGVMGVGKMALGGALGAVNAGAAKYVGAAVKLGESGASYAANKSDTLGGTTLAKDFAGGYKVAAEADKTRVERRTKKLEGMASRRKEVRDANKASVIAEKNALKAKVVYEAAQKARKANTTDETRAQVKKARDEYNKARKDLKDKQKKAKKTYTTAVNDLKAGNSSGKVEKIQNFIPSINPFSAQREIQNKYFKSEAEGDEKAQEKKRVDEHKETLSEIIKNEDKLELKDVIEEATEYYNGEIDSELQTNLGLDAFTSDDDVHNIAARLIDTTVLEEFKKKGKGSSPQNKAKLLQKFISIAAGHSAEVDKNTKDKILNYLNDKESDWLWKTATSFKFSKKPENDAIAYVLKPGGKELEVTKRDELNNYLVSKTLTP